MNRLAITIAILFVLNGCTFMFQDFDKYGKNYREIPLSLVTVGDSKEKVNQALGKPANVIGSKRFPNGLVEVWAYERWQARLGFDGKEEEYWLYFLNGTLEQWGRPGDWQKEADRVYEIRFR